MTHRTKDIQQKCAIVYCSTVVHVVVCASGLDDLTVRVDLEFIIKYFFEQK